MVVKEHLPDSQFLPLYPFLHLHVYPFISGLHTPPFLHGFSSQMEGSAKEIN